jgi:hypothetical protein
MVAAISSDSGTLSSSIKYECDTVARRGPITKQGVLVRWAAVEAAHQARA